ncbi:MAG: hypothetical protein GY796_20625 [Chloroflexi bacterium]|nr:hypothetical protein [Chloroflexota bacterium]
MEQKYGRPPTNKLFDRRDNTAVPPQTAVAGQANWNRSTAVPHGQIIRQTRLHGRSPTNGRSQASYWNRNTAVPPPQTTQPRQHDRNPKNDRIPSVKQAQR